jgi:hypothetical protein
MAEVAAILIEHTKELASHARQLRDARGAVSCCETALKIEHYDFKD